MANDVIAAIATPPGRGGIGVVRVSGPSLAAMAEQLIGKTLSPRRAVLAEFRDRNSAVIDHGLALYFPAPHSYTGEDVLELQGHGGRVVLQLLVRRCLELGARIAEPGEFTKRAFLNDKLDLAQAESVADLIDAATTEAARCAVRSLRGDFSRAIDRLVEGLVNLRLFVEATLDFPEEGVEFIEATDAHGKLAKLVEQLERLVAASKQGSLLREGIHVAIAGEPNVGKSSLLNRLAGEELAIVTDIPGTTRDTITQAIEIHGVPLHIIDTAGLRDTQDPVEKIGVARAWEVIKNADLVLWVLDSTHPPISDKQTMATRLPAGLPHVRVFNKIDLIGAAPGKTRTTESIDVALSAKTGAGIELLQEALLESVGWTGAGEGVFMARERHLKALAHATEHLYRAGQVFGQLELFAEELKQVQNALVDITGEFSADDLLGEIFSRFCIGK